MDTQASNCNATLSSSSDAASLAANSSWALPPLLGPVARNLLRKDPKHRLSAGQPQFLLPQCHKLRTACTLLATQVPLRFKKTNLIRRGVGSFGGRERTGNRGHGWPTAGDETAPTRCDGRAEVKKLIGRINSLGATKYITLVQLFW